METILLTSDKPRENPFTGGKIKKEGTDRKIEIQLRRNNEGKSLGRRLRRPSEELIRVKLFYI